MPLALLLLSLSLSLSLPSSKSCCTAMGFLLLRDLPAHTPAAASSTCRLPAWRLLLLLWGPPALFIRLLLLLL
jgi:hypothetical protein